MAGIANFYCISWRPKPTNTLRLSGPSSFKFSGRVLACAKTGVKDIMHATILKFFTHVSEVKVLTTEMVDFLSTRGERIRLCFADLSSKTPMPIDISHILPSSQYVCSGLADIQMNKLDKTCYTDQGLPNHNHAIVELLYAHQKMVPTSFLAAAFVANILMLAMPFEALAETCEADNSVFNMPLLLFVALVGATVGGLLARQRRGELKRLNDQLRQINSALRRQAKIESYAPTLSYAPIGNRIPENEIIVDSRKQELIARLKIGKNFLRHQDPERAFVEFKAALELAQTLKDPIEEKKAARGLGASLQRQRKYRDAIKYHSMVLAISDRVGEDSGNTEAYGAIADCYTELGDLEQAGRFYDRYISRLETD
ncbi:PREDICTED: protein FLUORESCENT IN BLUE LIGHT, chloroplastic [Nelumbo nucifera]|uniref:Protein FLUORESCENT IN BLUE LIGHT, chloroplastic n=1 Tax=Nelumbo nucifera TaxID=4432 RepID=A0A1U8A3T8_NELNU|nr:PREDICTED: protein FLUORESCENT IN BLUE LIGHT, chloroplastic [Nelumbo nucifera]